MEDVRASEGSVGVPRAVAADMAYRGHASVSYEAMRNCNVAYGGEGWGGSSCEAFPDARVDVELELPALGYIGEEVGVNSERRDVHASVELMWIMTVIRALPALTTYFCDTFLCTRSSPPSSPCFTVARKGDTRELDLHAPYVCLHPGLFCDKLLNREGPSPTSCTGIRAPRQRRERKQRRERRRQNWAREHRHDGPSV